MEIRQIFVLHFVILILLCINTGEGEAFVRIRSSLRLSSSDKNQTRDQDLSSKIVTGNSSVVPEPENENGNGSLTNKPDLHLELVANEIVQTLENGIKKQVANATETETNTNSSAKQRTLRILSPLDLSQQFSFDDDEEMATANYSESDIENMKLEIEEIFRSGSEDGEMEMEAVVTNSTNTNTTITIPPTPEAHVIEVTEKPTFFQSVKSKVDKGVSFFGGLVKKPFEIIGVLKPDTPTPTTPTPPLEPRPTKPPQTLNSNVDLDANVTKTNVPTSLRMPTNNRIIFPDDDEIEIVGVPQSKRETDNNDTGDIFFTPSASATPAQGPTVPECKPHEIVFKFKCELLFSKGPCQNGKFLLENEDTGQVNCEKAPCPDFPQHVPHNGKCVMQSYFNGCPAGMHLIIERSGKGYCDCKPGYIYSSRLDKCFEAYTQGPCQQSEYFIPGLGNNLQPQCVRNPCRRNGYVCYGQGCPQKGICTRLQSFCENGEGIFLVNPKTLKPECINLMSLEGLEGKVLGNVGPFSCSPGTKRDVTGKCRKSIRFTFS